MPPPLPRPPAFRPPPPFARFLPPLVPRSARSAAALGDLVPEQQRGSAFGLMKSLCSVLPLGGRLHRWVKGGETGSEAAEVGGVRSVMSGGFLLLQGLQGLANDVRHGRHGMSITWLYPHEDT